MAEKAIYVRHAIVTDGSRPMKGLLSGPCVGAVHCSPGGRMRAADYFRPQVAVGRRSEMI